MGRVGRNWVEGSRSLVSPRGSRLIFRALLKLNYGVGHGVQWFKVPAFMSRNKLNLPNHAICNRFWGGRKVFRRQSNHNFGCILGSA
jgi:hypothetical protein